jgi:hypothetical protein
MYTINSYTKYAVSDTICCIDNSTNRFHNLVQRLTHHCPERSKQYLLELYQL